MRNESSSFGGLRVILVAGMLILATCGFGCRSMVEALGYTTVDEELVQISAARDKATQEYVDATLPHLAAHFEGVDLARMKDLGETLKRVSAKEHLLLSGVPDGDGE
jgi:hypothetical protein